MCSLLYTLRSSGARELAVSAFYRHIAPLERKTKPINLNRKSMDFQRLATWVILAKIDTDVTWKIGGLKIYKDADEQARVKTSSTALFYRLLFIPRKRFGQLKFQNFKDAADWNTMSNVAVTTNNRVRFEHGIDDRFFGRFDYSAKEKA